MKVKIPSQIKIATSSYTVGFREHLKLDDGLVGVAYHRNKAIYIDPALDTSEKAQTLLHEAIHIIDRIYGCKIDEDDTDRLAQGMAELLVNNLGIEFDWSDVK